MRILFSLTAAAMALVAPAAAEPDGAAFAAFVAGDYEKSAELALAAKGADNHALAARAMNALAYFEEGRKESRKLAERALEYAEIAIKEDPSLPEGHLQAAIGLGLRGARMAPARAFIANVPNRVRNYLDAALKLDPNNQWALSTSAAWRLEVARRGGGKAYHAVPEEGFTEFQKARAIAPQSVMIAYECALRLLASGRAEWREVGLDALDAALASPATTAFDRSVQERVQAFKAAIGNGGDAEAAFIAAQP
ncbi:MAG: hypothetical protein ABL957_11150 [Parvularculaceae bacterium]